MELCMREKAVFFLPVNILTVWSPAFLAARHTTVCLDYGWNLLEVLPYICIYCIYSICAAGYYYLFAQNKTL